MLRVRVRQSPRIVLPTPRRLFAALQGERVAVRSFLCPPAKSCVSPPSFGQFLRFGSAPSPSSKDKESKEVLVRRSLDGCVSLYRGMPCSRGARFVPTKRVRPGARNRSLLQRRCPLPVLSDCRDSGRLALRAYI